MNPPAHVVDFSHVCMAYNDELLARGPVEVEDICAFVGLVTIGAMATALHELFSGIERRTTAWANRGTQGDR
jgi:hypothetical protein